MCRHACHGLKYTPHADEDLPLFIVAVIRARLSVGL